MISALNVYYYFKNKCKKEYIEYDNIKLKVLVYYAYCLYLVKYNKQLFKENVKVYLYGPDFKSLENINMFKYLKTNITSSIDIKDKIILDYIFDNYKCFTGIQLLNHTHNKEGPWYKSYKSKLKYIEDKDIINYYKNKEDIMSTEYSDEQINDIVKEGTSLLEKAVILLFDKYDELTIDTICEKLELNEDIVESIIFSLKYKGLIELKIVKTK